jgi:hypothetical protein
LWEKIDALGGPDPAWPEELRRRPDGLVHCARRRSWPPKGALISRVIGRID